MRGRDRARRAAVHARPDFPERDDANFLKHDGVVERRQAETQLAPRHHYRVAARGSH